MHNSTVTTMPLPAPNPVLHSIRTSRAYPPHLESRLAAELQHCTLTYPTLHPTTSVFTYPGGSSQSLVALRGTVPVTYRNATYKIPVHIWITPQHPQRPPVVFVVPTRAMVFRKGHPHVDARNGLVYLPYLNEWSGASNLSECVAAMVQAFSVKPPVYAKVPPTGQAQQNGVQKPVLQNKVENGPYQNQQPSVQNVDGRITQTIAQTIAQTKPLTQNGAMGYAQSTGGAQNEEERRMLIAKLNRKLNVALTESGRRRVGDCRFAWKMNKRLLDVKQKEVEGGGRDELRQELGRMEARRDLLKRWLQMHPIIEDEVEVEVEGEEGGVREEKSEGDKVDEMTRFRHVLKEQEVSAMANDAALGDALKVMDEGAAKGVIDIGEYVWRTRTVARDMFFERVMLKKVRGRMGELEGRVKRRQSMPIPKEHGLQERRVSESDAASSGSIKLPARRASRS